MKETEMIKRVFGARGQKCAVVLGVLAATAALGGCGNSSADDKSAGSSSQTTLRVGIDPSFPPWESEQGGDYVGSEIDMMNDVGKQLKMKVEFVKIGFDSLIPALDAGRIDVTAVGGWADSPKRRAAMNIVSYFKANVGIVVKEGDTVSNVAELCGKTVSTLSASVYVPMLEDASTKCEASGQSPIKILPLAQGAAVLAVKSGRAYGMVDSAGEAGYNASQNSGYQMNVLTDLESYDAGIGVAKSKAALAQKIQGAMQALVDNGSLTATLTKWNNDPESLLDTITLNGQGATQ